MTKNTTANCDYDDVGEAIREDRPLRAASHYRFRFAQDNLSFRDLEVSDPVPLGRQILTAAGLDPGDGISLFAILATGDFEDVRLDETFDLRGRGAEKFVAFQTDRLFKLTLKGDELEWGKPALSGSILYDLAKVGDDEAVFLEVRGGTDKLIDPGELIDLTAPGIEHFITGPKPVATYEIVVNSRVKIIDHQHVTFEEVVGFAFPGGHATNIRFSMTYRHAQSKPHAGELGPGGAVEVKPKGTIFNVTKTVQS
ncbi:MAG: multiubiquitin domain-containing protein [Chthoniobacterales bacterium]|jgi:hypothetical protein